MVRPDEYLPHEETAVPSGEERPDDDGIADLDERLDPQVRDLEVPTEDATEQALPVDPADLPASVGTEVEIDFEADEYDTLEQARVVPDPDDDYR